MSGLDFEIEINDDKNKNDLIQNQNNNKNNNNNNEKNKKLNESNDSITFTNFYRKSSHPIICLFHILFKLISIISFIILGFIIENESMAIILIIIFGSCDFWYTKNISGRILVGLRWWNKIKEDGTEVWIYESENEKNKSKGDTYIFWTSIYISFGFWLLCTFWELIRLKFIAFSVGLVLLIFNGVNLYGYFRCSKIQSQNIMNLGKDIVGKVGKEAIMSQLNY